MENCAPEELAESIVSSLNLAHHFLSVFDGVRTSVETISLLQVACLTKALYQGNPPKRRDRFQTIDISKSRSSALRLFQMANRNLKLLGK